MGKIIQEKAWEEFTHDVVPLCCHIHCQIFVVCITVSGEVGEPQEQDNLAFRRTHRVPL